MKTPIPDVRNSQCIDVFEVASPNSAQTSSTGDPGVSASARVDAPETINLESLADFNDEGDTAWNAQRRNDMARKMQRIAAGVNHYTHDEIEGSVIRAERGELAEVSR